METQKLARILVIFQLVFGQIAFVHADGPAPEETEAKAPCTNCGPRVVAPPPRLEVKEDNSLLWGLGGALLGLGVGYLIWGNQYKNQYPTCPYPPCPQYPGQPPYWQNLSPAYGQSPPYRPYIPYGPQSMPMQGGYSPYGIGGQGGMRQAPNMLPPVY